jgi:hypothetical protein
MDQRRMRVECHLAAHTQGTRQERVKGWVRHLSAGGMFVDTEARLPVGTRCEVALLLHGEDGRAAHAFGEVVRVEDGGMAIQILGIDTDAADAVHRIIEGQPTPHVG